MLGAEHEKEAFRRLCRALTQRPGTQDTCSHSLSSRPRARSHRTRDTAELPTFADGLLLFPGTWSTKVPPIRLPRVRIILAPLSPGLRARSPAEPRPAAVAGSSTPRSALWGRGQGPGLLGWFQPEGSCWEQLPSRSCHLGVESEGSPGWRAPGAVGGPWRPLLALRSRGRDGQQARGLNPGCVGGGKSRLWRRPTLSQPGRTRGSLSWTGSTGPGGWEAK